MASPNDIVEYDPQTEFPGVIGRTLDQSSPAWPQPSSASHALLSQQ